MVLERKDSPRGFDWWSFLRPSVLKLVIAILLPAVFAAVATRRIDNVMDFYGYLLTP
jgi:hypothetical protein